MTTPPTSNHQAPTKQTMKTSFWTYFTSAYGMIWMLLLFCSFLSETYIDAGVFGLVGFPIMAAIYAGLRVSKDSQETNSPNTFSEPPQMTNFLEEYPEFRHATHMLRVNAFHQWLNKPPIKKKK